jgi:hypothetical protein
MELIKNYMKRNKKYILNSLAIINRHGQIKYKNTLALRDIKKFYRFALLELL